MTTVSKELAVLGTELKPQDRAGSSNPCLPRPSVGLTNQPHGSQ